jgi:alkanesulfonate monooxygenase SsuD/methylene tetrahydromethanopterin reductase-like flavin-dependent oxidoreductase (luciferase family)
MEQMFAAVRQMAKEAGRDPASLAMIVRANLYITDKPLGADRAIFAGTLDQIREDAQACAKIGAHELIYDVTFEKQAQTIAGWLGLMEKLRKLV